MSHDEQELVKRVRLKDATALAELVELRRPALLAFVERQLSSAMKRKVEAEDIVQEASAEAVRALPSMDLTERDPFGWLCQVAERRIIDAHRRLFGAQKRDASREVSLAAPSDDGERTPLVDLLIASMTTASQVLSRNRRELQLMAALSSLPEEQREALRLRYMEGLPSKDIAERLGKTDGAIRVMLSRSLVKLQEILGPDAAR
ncbi:MAG: sigma-70 family RNA polymerase sigma factor [Pirellulales bacterium]